MDKLKVLVVEDDPNLGTLLKEYLNAKGIDTELANDGVRGMKAFKTNKFNFLILDVMMPKKDGFTLAKEIRLVNQQIPILFLTAKSMKEDLLKGFQSGGDDYMVKPFSMEELMARIEAISRRSIKEEKKETLDKPKKVGKYEFDYKLQKLHLDGTSQNLTTKENELLGLLVKSKNNVLDRNEALSIIWGDNNYFNGRSMDVYIAKLRKHLKQDENIQIVNVHGKGFKLIADLGE